MTLFTDATAITAATGGGYDVLLRQEFAIAGTKPNGGYMLACLGRAALDAAAVAGATQLHIVSAGAQYLASPEIGPAHIETEVLRVGRTATQVRARLVQGGALAVDAQIMLGNLTESTAPYWGGTPPVGITPMAQCQPAGMGSARGAAILFDPATSFRMTAEGPIASGDGEIRAWFDAGDEPLDPAMLLFAADALPPATFSVVMTGWVPTLDITIYVRAIPTPGPLRLRFRAKMIQDGFADEVCEAWDSAGRLVFQSTQLAALRTPAPNR